tara:strand:+ start:13 stop:657 length:645 start_codon:yes stop_codon:yes gene_type:complete
MTMRSLAPLPDALFEKFPTLQMFTEDELLNFGNMIICNRSGKTTIAFEVDPDFIIPLLRKFSVPISMELFQWASTAAGFVYCDLDALLEDEIRFYSSDEEHLPVDEVKISKELRLIGISRIAVGFLYSKSMAKFTMYKRYYFLAGAKGVHQYKYDTDGNFIGVFVESATDEMVGSSNFIDDLNLVDVFDDTYLTSSSARADVNQTYLTVSRPGV